MREVINLKLCSHNVVMDVVVVGIFFIYLFINKLLFFWFIIIESYLVEEFVLRLMVKEIIYAERCRT